MTETVLVGIVAGGCIGYGLYGLLTGSASEGVGLIVVGLGFVVVRIIHALLEMKV